MAELVPCLLAGVFIGGILLLVVAIFVSIALVARHRGKKAEVVWAAVEDTFSLSRVPSPPEMRGIVDGVEVVIDVTTTWRDSPGVDYGGRHRVPWTRVRAMLPIAVGFEVHGSEWKGETAAAGLLQPTGDATFDERYSLFTREGVELPDGLRQALLATDRPVHVFGDAVVWMHYSNVHDVELFTAAVRSCAAVAASMRS